jgi:hypothetical protein
VVATPNQQVVVRHSLSRGVVIDVVVEGASIVLTTAGGVGRGVRAAARPMIGVVLRPPLVGPWLQPATWVKGLARRGHLHRHDAEEELARFLDRFVPLVLQTVLDRVDLNELVRERVDLDGLVASVDIDAIAQRLDVDAVVAHLDLRSLADQVIADVDLPELIRASTGSVTSEAVRGVRMRSISGDDAVARAVERLRMRRRRALPPATSETP